MSVFLINPGHGGIHSGAAANGIIEKQAVLTIGLKLRELLKSAGHTVYMTREKDENDPLAEVHEQDKALRAKYGGMGLLISLHLNAGGGDGAEVYAQNGSNTSKRISQYILDELGKIGQNSRGVKTKLRSDGKDYYQVLRDAYSLGSTAALAEIAFLDTKDHEFVDTVEEQYKVAEAICKALLREFPAVTKPLEPVKVENDKLAEELKKQLDIAQGQLKTVQAQLQAANDITLGYQNKIKQIREIVK